MPASQRGSTSRKGLASTMALLGPPATALAYLSFAVQREGNVPFGPGGFFLSTCLILYVIGGTAFMASRARNRAGVDHAPTRPDDTPSSTGTRPVNADGPASPALVLALLAPLVLHEVMLGVDLRRLGSLELGRLDVVAYLLLFAYTAAAVLVCGSRERALRTLMLMVSSLLCAVGFEVATRAAGLSVAGTLPMRPMHRLNRAITGLPGISGEISFTVNKMGLRAPVLWPDNREDRILCVGGSTTECLYVTDEKSWPWLLGTLLTRDLGRPVLAANAGKGGHFSLHHVYLLQHFDLAQEFGRVIVLCGINDSGIYKRNNYEKRARSVPQETFHSPLGVGAYYRRSFLLELVGRLAPPKPGQGEVEQDGSGQWVKDAQERRKRLLSGQPEGVSNFPPLAPALRRYRENLRAIAHLCRTRQQELIFMTQPSLYSGSMSPELIDLLLETTDDRPTPPAALNQALEAFNEVMRDVCRTEAVICVDLAMTLPKDTSVFYDDCHFNIPGCERVANTLERHLLPEMREPHTR
jgi:hypothetical protein